MTNKELKIGEYYYATAGSGNEYTMKCMKIEAGGTVSGPFLSIKGDRYDRLGSFVNSYVFHPATEGQIRWLASCINAGKLVPEPELENYQIY